MKLDVDVLRYFSKDDFRVLTAVEMGMRNHEIVPAELIDRIAHGGTYKVLKNLLKHKLLHHDSSKYNGFRLTYLGYDFLAIKTMVNRGIFTAVGRQIGVGKESDIFEVINEDGLVMALENHGFPVPSAVDCNRHCVVMSLVQGYPLVQVKQLQNPESVFGTIINLVVRLAEHGLIHCDFNEFNIMIDDDEKVTMIDFPQMVSVSHCNAQMYFDRDVECIIKFFRKRFNMSFSQCTDDSEDSDAARTAGFLDKELAASGFTKNGQDDIEKFIEGGVDRDPTEDNEGAEDEDVSDLDQTNNEGIDSLCFLEEGEQIPNFNERVKLEESNNGNKVGQNNGDETHDDRDKEEDDEVVDDEDPDLIRSLNKQRRRAIAAARRGERSSASRNSYKDKGGMSHQNSKIQRQLSSW
ncbi:serine/threonine-protein kinase rio2-like [Tripterygium wilfordii]|uniref:non-specific serine/threonine protein kinase n=1 Tax=Tripterygium wilfordii TaxID=458696 RepID=A0A7J7DMG2_TRIWF|nr:serine/threonine-protein kinase rio2-like [Tripterygium wilfordii]